MPNITHDDAAIKDLLTGAKVIAVVGHSDKPHRTSYKIAKYLRAIGYTVYPVNPTVDTIDGEISYPSIADVPEPIDIVNVFRQSKHVVGIADEVIDAGVPVMWTQLGVVDEAAAARAAEAGVHIVMNRCIKIEHSRLIEMVY